MTKKEEIINAMYELFSEKGYNASMSDLSKRVGIKVQSIYSHYESKDEIITLVLEREINTSFERFEKRISSLENKSCEEALKEIFFSIITYFQDYKKLRFWRNISLIQNEELRNQFKMKIQFNERVKNKKMGGVLVRGINNKEIKEDNFEGIIWLYVAMIQGTLDGMLLYNNCNFDIYDYAEKVWKAYWDGVKK